MQTWFQTPGFQIDRFALNLFIDHSARGALANSSLMSQESFPAL